MRIQFGIGLIVALVAQIALAQSNASKSRSSVPETTQPRPVAEDKYDWTSPASPWSTSCAVDTTGSKACQMIQTLNVAETGQHLLSAIIRYPAGKKHPVLLLTLPHGLFFQAGVRLQIDKGRVRVLPYQSSDTRGAYSGMALDAATLSALKRGNELKITIYGAAKKPLAMVLSLKGFTAELAQLNSAGRTKP